MVNHNMRDILLFEGVKENFLKFLKIFKCLIGIQSLKRSKGQVDQNASEKVFSTGKQYRNTNNSSDSYCQPLNINNCFTHSKEEN